MPEANFKRTIPRAEKEQVGSTNQPISSVLSKVVDVVFQLTSAQGAAIVARVSKGILCQASTGLAPPLGSPLLPDSTFSRECFETGRVVFSEDAENDPRIGPTIASSLHLRSALAVPILSQGLVLGAILVFSSRTSAFDHAHVAVLQSIAHSLAPILAKQARAEKSVPGAPQLAGSRALALAEEHPNSLSSLSVGLTRRLNNSARIDFLEHEGKPRFLHDSVGIFHRLGRRPISARVLLVAGSVLLLLLLVFFGVSRHRSAKIRDASTIGSSRLDTAAGLKDRGIVQTPNGKNLAVPSSLEAPTPIASSGSSSREEDRTKEENPAVGSSQTATSSRRTLRTVEAGDHVPKVIKPAAPELVIEGAPRGAQIFIDDRLTSSIDSNGQAEILKVGGGEHSLRLTLNGYQDYEQRLDLRDGQTSTVVAKLEPFGLPILVAPSKPPILGVTPAIPLPVRSIKVSVPDFVLNRSVKTLSGWVTAVAFSVDGQRLASGTWNRGVKFWNVPTGQELSTVATKMKEIEAIALSRDGHWLAAEDSTNTVILWDATTGKELRAFAGNNPSGILGSYWVYSIAFSPDGRWLATSKDDKTIRLWDVQTGRAVRDLVGLRRSVIYIAFSPDGRWLASGIDDKSIGIWDVRTGQVIRRLVGHRKPVNAVAFSPDGRSLASASADKSVRLWNIDSGREMRILTGHGDLVSSLAFSPNGLWLASGSWDNTIKIWNVVTGKEVQTLAGHSRHVYAVAFDSHGQWLASGSEDGTIQLWRWLEGVDQSRVR